MKQHQNSPSCKCSNQDSKQLILSRLRERGRELVCQGLQNYQASGVHSRNFIVFHNGRGEALSNGFPSQELALKFSKPSPTQPCSGFLSSHGLQTAARPSSQRYGTIQPRRVKCKLPWQLTLPMMLLLRSFLPSFRRPVVERERERTGVAFVWNGNCSKVGRKGAKQCDRTLERRRISWGDAGLEDERAR